MHLNSRNASHGSIFVYVQCSVVEVSDTVKDKSDSVRFYVLFALPILDSYRVLLPATPVQVRQNESLLTSW